jgi:hypothetical protein
MSGENLNMPNISNICPIPECNSCDENGIKIGLDRMPHRAIFAPEDLDDNPRADCAIFFPEEGQVNRNPLYRNVEEHESQFEPNYVAVVELKSTFRNANSVKDQIEGGIDFVIDVLREFGDPPWGLECYCLVPHETSGNYSKRRQLRISKNIDGEHFIFWVEGVNNGESLRDLVEQDIRNENI